MEKSTNQEIASEYVKTFKKSENDFSMAIQNFGKVSPSNEKENIHEHWDVKLEIKFDVKALRKINRNDSTTDENIHWVELKNVQSKDGWLYGKSDAFAFETNDYWILVEKEKLQKFIAEKCMKKEWTPTPALYKLYRRKERQDIITLVKTIDLIFISDKMIPKNLKTI